MTVVHWKPQQKAIVKPYRTSGSDPGPWLRPFADRELSALIAGKHDPHVFARVGSQASERFIPIRDGEAATRLLALCIAAIARCEDFMKVLVPAEHVEEVWADDQFLRVTLGEPLLLQFRDGGEVLPVAEFTLVLSGRWAAARATVFVRDATTQAWLALVSRHMTEYLRWNIETALIQMGRESA